LGAPVVVRRCSWPDSGRVGLPAAARPLVHVPRLLRLVPGAVAGGIARGGQVQQLQALLTLLWSALLLGEQVTATTVLVALAVIASVVWAQRGRTPRVMAPQE